MIVMFQCPVCQVRRIDNAESAEDVVACSTTECDGESVVVDHVDEEIGWWVSAG